MDLRSDNDGDAFGGEGGNLYSTGQLLYFEPKDNQVKGHSTSAMYATEVTRFSLPKQDLVKRIAIRTVLSGYPYCVFISRVPVSFIKEAVSR